MYDRERGSGMLYYEYDLNDGGAVLISVALPFQPSSRVLGITHYESTNGIPLFP